MHALSWWGGYFNINNNINNNDSTHQATSTTMTDHIRPQQ
jgi:hypothetical protein